jgi:Protein of unknown function (DUF1329)
MMGLGALIALCTFAGTASAEMRFDPENFKSLVDASSSETIPLGTTITLQNWKEYKRFMPVWMWVAYGGDYHWKIGAQPYFTIKTGPTSNFPLPAKYQEDTEKYAGQTQLVRTPEGGMTIKNYTAGMPFPNPAEPDKAFKILYNVWLLYRPAISRYFTWDWLVDRYGNTSEVDTDDTWYQLSHLSEPGKPINLPYANGMLFAARYIVAAPEQSRYTTQLQLQPDDPSRLQENYVFLPSLRRSLRLSSAARCAPVLGTDYINDDGGWMPTNFTVVYLGEKKLLVPIMDRKKAYEGTSYAGGGKTAPGTFPGWPKASAVDHWELRPHYIIDLRPLPILGNYCYSHRIFYVDKQTNISILAGNENYDRAGKLYKLLWGTYPPYKLYDQETIFNYSTSMSMAMDFQNKHVTANNDTKVQVNEQVPAEYQDAATYSTPGGLSRIMK